MIGRVVLLCSVLMLPGALALDHKQHQKFLGLQEPQYEVPGKHQYEDSTADPTVCKNILMMIYVGFFIQVIGSLVMQNESMANGGASITLIAGFIGMFYSAQHGIVTQAWAGKLDPEGKWKYCHAIWLVIVIMWCFSACICFCCAVGVTCAVVQSMKADREETMAKLDRQVTRKIEDIIDSPEFKAKCKKAFQEADKDKNGKLDLSELQHVVLFDLSETEKANVTKHHLFDEAFRSQDANKDNFIDPAEFEEVMKWIIVKAKAS